MLERRLTASSPRPLTIRAAGGVIVGITTLTVVAAGAAMRGLIVERGSSFGDALWWASGDRDDRRIRKGEPAVFVIVCHQDTKRRLSSWSGP